MRDLRTAKSYRREDVKPGEWFVCVGDDESKRLAIAGKALDSNFGSACLPDINGDYELDRCGSAVPVVIEGRDGRQTVEIEDMKPGRMYAAIAPGCGSWSGPRAFMLDACGNYIVVASGSTEFQAGDTFLLPDLDGLDYARCFIDELAENPEDRIVLIDDTDA